MMNMGVGGWLLMLLFWGGLIVLALWLVRAMFPHATEPPGRSPAREPSATEILDRRYARGEISREEYELMQDTLSR